jgi:hypothetical protein
MASDLFDRLAELDVPPPPAQFDHQLHERVNRSLIVGQMIDLVAGGIPFALVHFARAVLGLVTFTATGRYESNSKNRHP